MPTSKTGRCTSCGEPMWTGRGTAGPDAMMCRPCRKEQREAERPDHTVGVCGECGQVWTKSVHSHADRCETCRLPECEVCGERFVKSYSKQRTCGRQCGALVNGWLAGRGGWSWKVYFLTCVTCGELYSARSPNHLHTAPACIASHRRQANRRAYRSLVERSNVATRMGRTERELAFEQRLLSRIAIGDPKDCWVWVGTLTPAGYGQISRHSRNVPAHRAVYEHIAGPIPAGLDLDHECHNSDRTCPGGLECEHTACVNPDHLVPTTRAQNNANAAAQRRSRAA